MCLLFFYNKNKNVAEIFTTEEILEGIELSTKDVLRYDPDTIYSYISDPENTPDLVNTDLAQEIREQLGDAAFNTFKGFVVDHQFMEARDWYASARKEHDRKVKKGPVSSTGTYLYQLIPQKTILRAMLISINCRSKRGVEKILSAELEERKKKTQTEEQS